MREVFLEARLNYEKVTRRQAILIHTSYQEPESEGERVATERKGLNKESRRATKLAKASEPAEDPGFYKC